MENRLKFIHLLIKALLVILVFQCFYLQILRYPYYRRLSEQNCIRTLELGIPRGKILDRNGRILAVDRPCFNLVFSPYDLKEPAKVASLLSSLIDVDRDEMLDIFNKKYPNPFDRHLLKRDLTQTEISNIEEHAYELTGVFVQAGIDRNYTLGELACHLLGYTGEISMDELDDLKDEGLKPGEFTGKYGLEKFYDSYLRGKPGGYQVEVDAAGHQRKILGETRMVPGNNLVLTIDQSMQEICSQELGNSAGAVVAMDPKNGEVLALVSNPGFDPKNIAKFLKPSFAASKPFLDRVISGQYPPGSIFKIVTETAGLESGTIGEHDRIECTGTLILGDRVFHCWKEEGHGWVDIDQALPESCDIFFGTVGMKMGIKTLLSYAALFDVGNETGIDLPGEKNGLLPNEDNSGGVLNLAIGQGALLMTPVQLCSLVATVANGGNIWKPFIVEKIVDPQGNEVESFSPVLKKTVFISDETLSILKTGLKNVVAFGTGGGAKLENVEVAGKTGTAQIASSELNLPTHGAFACYAPADMPTVSLVVFLDTAGSAEAARIAGKILKRYFTPEVMGEQTGTETGAKTFSETQNSEPESPAPDED